MSPRIPHSTIYNENRTYIYGQQLNINCVFGYRALLSRRMECRGTYWSGYSRCNPVGKAHYSKIFHSDHFSEHLIITTNISRKYQPETEITFIFRLIVVILLVSCILMTEDISNNSMYKQFKCIWVHTKILGYPIGITCMITLCGFIIWTEWLWDLLELLIAIINRMNPWHNILYACKSVLTFIC